MSRKDIKIQEVQFPFCRGFLHVVERGDTLYKLSRKYGVRLSDIMLANPYVNVYNLQIGDELCIPSGNVIVINQDDLERIREMVPGVRNEAPPAPGMGTLRTAPNINVTNPSNAMPNSSNAMPNSSTTMPNSSTVMPNSSTTMPNSSTIIPTPSTVAPNASTVMPTPSAVIPNTSTVMPTPSATMPNMGEEVTEEIIISGNETLDEILERLGITLEEFEMYIRQMLRD